MDTLIAAIGFGLVTASILALGAVGFTLQFGVTNILNLAYGEIMIASAFAAYVITNAGYSAWWGLLGGAAFGAIFSPLLNRLVFTPFIRHGTNLFGMVIVTIALSFILQNVLQVIFGATFFSLEMPPPKSYRAGGMIFTGTGVAIMAIAVAAMAAIHLLLRYTKVGKAMRGTAANADLARSCGIPTARIIDLGWLLSGALCGAAGVALVMNYPAFTPATGAEFLIPIVAAAILGGIGHPYGAMLGALIIGVSTEVMASLVDPAYKDAFAFAILVVVFLFRPQGIFSEVAVEKDVVA